MFLMIATLSTHGAGAIDSFEVAYRETTFLVVEADLRLHHCHLSELSLHVLQPPQATIGSDSQTSPGATSPTVLLTREQAASSVSLCRREAEESIKAKLQVAEHELSDRPIAQEKLKGFVAVWLSAMKVIPRMVSRTEVLLAQQEDDRRRILQKQSELEVELFWSLDRARGWVSHSSSRGDRQPQN